MRPHQYMSIYLCNMTGSASSGEKDTMLYDPATNIRILVVQDDVAEEDPTITTAVIVYTVVSAVSILCNFLVLFLISRKKYLEEETKQPTYYRIM